MNVWLLREFPAVPLVVPAPSWPWQNPREVGWLARPRRAPLGKGPTSLKNKKSKLRGFSFGLGPACLQGLWLRGTCVSRSLCYWDPKTKPKLSWRCLAYSEMEFAGLYLLLDHFLASRSLSPRPTGLPRLSLGYVCQSWLLCLPAVSPSFHSLLSHLPCLSQLALCGLFTLSPSSLLTSPAHTTPPASCPLQIYISSHFQLLPKPVTIPGVPETHSAPRLRAPEASLLPPFPVFTLTPRKDPDSLCHLLCIFPFYIDSVFKFILKGS